MAPANVTIRLLEREIGATWSRLYSQVPRRLQTPIEAIVDEASDLKSCVLLGFSRDGDHLISYTSAPVAAADSQEGVCLQLWTFEHGARCRRLVTVPLFRAGGSLHQEDEEDSLAAPLASLSVTVAETPGGELLVVHGRPTDVVEGDRLVNYLTLIPGPQLVSRAQHLQVAHLSYHTAPPHPPFNPFTSILLAHSSALGLPHIGPAPVFVACNMGDGVRLIRVAVTAPHLTTHRPSACQGGQQQRQQQQQQPAAQQEEPDGQQQEQQEESGMLQPAQQRGAIQSGSGSSPGELSPQAGTRHPLAAMPAASNVRPGRGAGSACEAFCQEQQPGTHLRQQHQGQQGALTLSAGGSSSGTAAPLVHEPRSGSPDALAGPAEAGTGGGSGMDGLLAEMDLREDTIACCCCSASSRSEATHPSSSALADGPGQSAIPLAPSSRGAPSCLAAVTAAPAGPALDWEEFLFRAVQGQGLPPQNLEDYAAALTAQGAWQGQPGVLAVALLRLRGQGLGLGGASPALQALLVHMAAATGLTQVVEVLVPPFPWQDDLDRALQQPGGMGGASSLSLDRAAAFAPQWLRSRYAAPGSHRQLPHVLTNRSVLEEGRSLRFIAHPVLPLCILGWGCGGERG